MNVLSCSSDSFPYIKSDLCSVSIKYKKRDPCKDQFRLRFNKKYKKNKEHWRCNNEEDGSHVHNYKQFESRQMKGFSKCSSKCSYELQQLFEERYGSKG